MASRRIDVHRAVERGDLAVLNRYLDAGGDVEKKDTEYGAAPIHWASLRGRLDALSLLLEQGAGLESRTGTDGTPLVWGCMGGDAKVVLYLLQQGADIDAVTKGKGTALHHATNSGHPAVVAILLENGADPNAKDNRGERPGDRFDPEVSDAVRRAITKVLAKAKGEGSTTKGSSRSKGRDKSRGYASIARKPRSGGSDNGNDNGNGSNGADHERGDGHRANSSGSQREQAGWEQVKPVRSDASVRASAAAALYHSNSVLPFSRSGAQSEEELLSAAEASIAAAAWTPTVPASKPRLMGSKGSSTRAASERKRSGSGADRDTTSSAAAQSNGNSVAPAAASAASAAATAAASAASAAAAAAAATNVPDEPRSSRSARADHAEGTAGFRAPERARAADGAAAVASLQRKLWSPTASATDPQLDDLRRQVKDLALTVAVAEKRDIEGRLALRQALAESEKRAEGVGAAAQARSKKLAVLVEALERRLSERDEQVKSLKAEVEDRDARLRQAEQEVTSLRAQLKGQSGDAVTPVVSKRVDAPLGGLSTPSPLPAPERGGSKSYTRTQSSPALSPRVSASLRQLASAVDAGEGVGIGIGGGIENSPSLNKRHTVGTGTSPADESFSSQTGVAGPGTGTSKAGVLAWWKRNDLKEDGQAANKEKPRPITEDQERLGNLYSMIARR